MRVGTDVLAVALLTLISTWGLSGCSKQEPAPTTNTDTSNKEAVKGNEHARHAEPKTADHKGEEHARHEDNKDLGHKSGEHKHHEHGERRDETPQQGRVKVGDKVPDFSVQTLDGKSVKLSELQKDAKSTRNGVVVLSFWCTTCHSCRDVEELLAKLYKEYEGQAAVFALTANANETAQDVAAFLKKNRLDLPIVLDPKGDTADLFGVKRTTTTVLIDGDRVLRYCGQFRQKDGGSAAAAALQAVLAGKEVAVKTTPHQG
jgi:peroxiredoxin